VQERGANGNNEHHDFARPRHDIAASPSAWEHLYVLKSYSNTIGFNDTGREPHQALVKSACFHLRHIDNAE
jgi:hypothetical protein